MTAPNTGREGMSPLLVDTDTVAADLGGVSRGHVRNLVADGTLRAVKVGGRLMFRTADVTAYVESLPAATLLSTRPKRS